MIDWCVISVVCMLRLKLIVVIVSRMSCVCGDISGVVVIDVNDVVVMLILMCVMCLGL